MPDKEPGATTGSRHHILKLGNDDEDVHQLVR